MVTFPIFVTERLPNQPEHFESFAEIDCMRRDVFQAIADPTRREILMLIARKPLPLNSIAGNFEVSRPAISKHIRILTECGIVAIRAQGRERYCEVQADKLSEVTQWIERFRVFWSQKLDALGEFLERSAAAEKPGAAEASPANPTTAQSQQAAKPAATRSPQVAAASPGVPSENTPSASKKSKPRTAEPRRAATKKSAPAKPAHRKTASPATKKTTPSKPAPRQAASSKKKKQ